MDNSIFNQDKNNQPFTYVNFHSSPEITGSIGDSNRSDDIDTNSKGRNFLQINYYQKFFDIDQEQVFARIFNSFYPKRNVNYINDFIQPNPDLYGPFWISVTLVFAVAIFGNLATFIQNYGNQSMESIGDFGWVTAATSLTFFYVTLVPAIIYLFQWYIKCDIQYGYFELLCMYGYSLSIFIPVSLFWFFLPFNLVRWMLTISSVAATGTVLVLALWPIVRNESNRLISVGFIASLVCLHILLALCFQEYFFSSSSSSSSTQTISHNADRNNSSNTDGTGPM